MPRPRSRQEAAFQREHVGVVGDQRRKLAVSYGESVLLVGVGEAGDPGGRGCEEHPVQVPGSDDPERGREDSFPDSGRVSSTGRRGS